MEVREDFFIFLFFLNASLVIHLKNWSVEVIIILSSSAFFLFILISATFCSRLLKEENAKLALRVW